MIHIKKIEEGWFSCIGDYMKSQEEFMQEVQAFINDKDLKIQSINVYGIPVFLGRKIVERHTAIITYKVIINGEEID